MKILVTGSAGFIGHALCHRLLDEGHEVVGLDNVNDYYAVSLKRARLDRLSARTGFTNAELDLCDAEPLNELFTFHRFDRVCNLAAQAGVRYSLTHPMAYQHSNIEGFLCVLEACRHHDVGRLVYASSSSVYGGNTSLPFRESDTVDRPVSLYAATKKANELMAHTYSHLYKLPTVGLRFFTVYGPWGRPDMAAWLFTEAMLNNKPIKVFNHGNMQRDFTYIDDIVQGIMGALFSEKLGQYEVINLGNHRSEALMDMIGIIADCLGVTPSMEMLPMQPGDVPATYADITKARELLGFEPATPIGTGLPRFVEWYREYHNLG